MRVPRNLAKLSLHVRLVAGFAVAMLAVLVCAGAFVYWRVQVALDRELNTDLADTSSQLARQVTPSGEIADQSALLTGERFQVLDARGLVLSRSATAPTTALLDPQTVEAALRGPVERDIGDLLPANDQPLRVYASPLDLQGGRGPAVLAVAADRSQRDEALRELLGQLVLAGLAMLVVTTVVGEVLAKASLRPVERYRRQAADIAAGAAGVRLDVPARRDDEITRLGHTLNGMLEELEQSLEHERRFVNDASHELRTPLTLIGTRVQLARRRPRTVPEHEAVLEEIESDIARLSRLADQLLEIGTIREGGTASTARSSTDLAAVARGEVERRRALAGPDSPYRTGGSLQVRTTGPAQVDLHRVLAERLVGNLLDNAAAHGAPPATVVVDCADGVVRLRVSDAGPGMDAAMLAMATQRFARADRARSRPGSGLGLAIVRDIVVAAGGQVRLCFGGQHEHVGAESIDDVPCDPGAEMTVTVLLPDAGPDA
jgi:two-component system, OmpR family, sensor kinase